MSRPPKHPKSLPSPPVTAELLGHAFRFRTAPGLFCADRVDDGTRLLLEHLPPRAPASVFDLGCGYGALGLPVAAAHPSARVVLADRDLLAVEMAHQNAAEHALAHVETRGSLGYRDLPGERFDWVLCNVPARIGEQAIAYILAGGLRRLTSEGEVRVVVIRDLGPVVERVAAEHRWTLQRVADGARHVIFALAAQPADEPDHEQVYARDQVSLAWRDQTLRLERPHDINEDPSHASDAVPLLLETLPRQPRRSAFVWRGGYGIASIALALSGTPVLAADKDLLATTYTRRNARLCGVEIETRDALTPAQALGPDDRPAFAVGELSPIAGAERAARELLETTERLASGAEGLWLAPTRFARECLERLSKHKTVRAHLLVSHARWSILRSTRIG